MVAKFSVKNNGGTFAKDLANYADQVQRAGADALTWTAYEAQRMMYDEFRLKLDNPTPFTMRSLFVKKATVSKPEAELRTKDGFGSVPAGRYLDPEVYGGPRAMKSSERKLGSYVVPSKYARLDAYGNVPGAVYKKALSALKVDGDQSASGSKASKRKRKNESYFIRDKIVFRRSTHSVGGGDFSAIIPQFILIDDVPNYSRRIDWEGVAQRAFDQFYEEKLTRALSGAGGS